MCAELPAGLTEAPVPGVRFGVSLAFAPPDTVRTLAARIEALGYDSIWTGDHVQFHNPTFESLTLLSHLAALTRRVRLGTSVYLPALRQPTIAAKTAATVDILSGGRLVFGVGVGGEFPKEFEAVGVPHAERGQRVDEGIEVCRLLWSKAPASFEGRFLRFADVSLSPRPAQAGGPPRPVRRRPPPAAPRGGGGRGRGASHPGGARAPPVEVLRDQR